MFNYKNEPIPLRIGRTGSSGWSQRSDLFGDMSNLFNSSVHRSNPGAGSFMTTVDLRKNHGPGDPSTEIFESYDGDKIQVRLVQGAQEVQHNFTLHGQKWHRQSADPLSPYVSSQEVGISEHFEFEMQAQPAVLGNPATLMSDYLYHGGSIDSLWNGAWGMFRSYAAPKLAVDPRTGGNGQLVRCRLAVLGVSAGGGLDPACNGARPATSAANATVIHDFSGLTVGNGFRPPNARGRLFCVDAVAGRLVYNAMGEAIVDSNAMRYVLRATYPVPAERMSNPPPCPIGGGVVSGLSASALPPDAARPLVLRMKSGEVALVNLINRLPGPPARTTGNAVLPPIVSTPGEAEVNDLIAPSGKVGLHAGLVSYVVRSSDGVNVGRNAASADSHQVANPGFTARYSWYAGTVESSNSGGTVSVAFRPFATDRGMVTPLSSMADPIRHAAAGLVGALVIEPADADLDGAYAAGRIRDGGISATMCRSARPDDCWDEFVVVYQDGLNLKQEASSGSQSIPDCHICDDSYDSGDVAINFRTEPFWARLGLPRQDPSPDPEAGSKPVLVNLNKYDLPDGFLLPGYRGRDAATFCTAPNARVVVHAVHPGGRARQRAFVINGLRYDDLGIARFGSPHAGLLGPQKAMTADLGRVADGLWLYRDGPAQFFAGGAWGYIDARSTKPAGACPSQP